MKEPTFTEPRAERVFASGGGIVGGVLILCGLAGLGAGAATDPIGLFTSGGFLLFGFVIVVLSIPEAPNQLAGPCPCCDSEVKTSPRAPGVDWPACKKRVVVRDGRFYRID